MNLSCQQLTWDLELKQLTNDEMNFLDYATRIQEQAVAAAKRIPTFDDMAANDEYIHTEEFRVRGKKPETVETSARVAPAYSNLGVDPDDTSSMGSWSLLDRPPVQLRTPVLPAALEASESSSTNRWTEPAPMSSSTSLSSEAPSTSPWGVKRHSSSSLQLLSLVANALDDEDINKNDTNDFGRGRIDTMDNDENNSTGAYSDDDSTDSDAEDEANDPIMSLIRKNKPTRQIQSKINSRQTKERKSAMRTTSSKYTQRFLHDLDERVSTLQDDRMEAGVPAPTSEPNPHAQHGMKLPLGGWMRSIATSSFNRMFSGSEAPSGVVPYGCKNQQKVPPLARERPQKSKESISVVDRYPQASSTSVLGDAELAQLAKMTHSSRSGTCTALYVCIGEYQNFAFIIFTLALALFVYFFQNSADGVS